MDEQREWFDIVNQYSELIKELRLNPNLDKTKIADKISVSTPTLYKSLEELKKSAIITDDTRINPRYGTLVGISIGTSICKVVFLHFDFTPYSIEEFKPYRNEFFANIQSLEETADNNELRNYVYFKTPDTFVDLKHILDGIFKCIQNNINCGRLKLLSIGISSTGTVDEKENIICQSHNLRYLDGRKINNLIFDDKLDYFSSIKVPLFLIQNCKASIIAEKFKLYELDTDEKLHKKNNIVAVYLEYGIGAGIIIEGKLYSGIGYAGEIGHIPIPINIANIIDMEKLKKIEVCTCGSTYCIDQIIRSLVFENSIPHFRDMGSNEIATFLNNHPDRIQYLGKTLGYIINLLAALLNVDLVIFTGKLYKCMSDQLNKYIEETMDESNLKYNRTNCKIYKSEIGSLAPAIGAAIYSCYKVCDIKLDWS